MRLTLQRKFFLALALLILVLLAIFVASSRLSLQRGIGPYVAEVELSRLDWLVANLEQAYATEGSWDFVQRDPRAWHRLQLFNIGGGGPNRVLPPFDRDGSFGDRRPPRPRGIQPQIDVLPPRLDPPPPPDALQYPRASADSVYTRMALLAADGTQVLAGHPYSDRMLRKQINVHGHTVGYLALAPIEGLGTRADRAFVAQQSTFLLLTGAAGLLLALLISAVMARRWLQPVQRLADAARSIAGGRLEVAVAVPVHGGDELAQLARTFNEMSAALASIERTRQQWLHDVAHELRTPVAAMRAEIEALQDGVRVYDGGTAQRLHGQVMRLGTLVEDLQRVMSPVPATLTMEEVHPLHVLLEVADAMQPRLAQAQVRLEGIAPLQALSAAEDPVLRGDASRLGQVFMNLLENSARYTQAGGKVVLAARIEASRLRIRVEDSAPVPAAQDLPRLFERFFRGEGSRSRATGGSGLGLAICRSIVQAHRGAIRADASALGGLMIEIELPFEAT
jgi:two-component system sensor histidine kinase BaeS